MAGKSRAAAGAKGAGRVQANKHRAVQVARTGGRKLFDEDAKSRFLEWFAATCNVSLSAEQAGFNYKTAFRHRMNDADFGRSAAAGGAVCGADAAWERFVGRLADPVGRRSACYAYSA